MTDIRRGATSASNAEADLNCAGRHMAQRGIPEPPESEDASSGRLIHAALADPDNPEKLAALDEPQRETFDRCRELEAKLIKQLFPNATPKLFREQRYWVTYGPIEHSGQADLVARSGVLAAIIDYKTGRGDVAESPYNLQLRDLAPLVSNALTVDAVATAILQPWVTMDPQVCMYDRETLDRAAFEMAHRVHKSNDPNSPRTAGDVQCRYCRAKGICKEYQAWAGAVVPMPQSLFDVPMSVWTLEQRSRAADNLDRAQACLDLVKDQLKTWLRVDPAAVPGWTLKDGVFRDAINDPQAVFERFTALGGKLEQYIGTVNIVKTKLKAALKEATGLKGAALDKKLDQLIDGLVTTTQNSPSLTKNKGQK